MIINYDFYYCHKCKKSYHFDTSKEYSKLCPDCNGEMEFWANMDGDTELEEQRKNQPVYAPSIYPPVNCPCCNSANVRKIGMVERGISVGVLGLFSKKINKSFQCNTCGYTW